MVAELMVNEAVPLEVRVMGSVADEPTATLPKLRLVVLRDSFGCDVVPVPLRLTILVAPVVELLEMVRVPVVALAAVGL
jgi:hypothetical protein